MTDFPDLFLIYPHNIGFPYIFRFLLTTDSEYFQGNLQVKAGTIHIFRQIIVFPDFGQGLWTKTFKMNQGIRGKQKNAKSVLLEYHAMNPDSY